MLKMFAGDSSLFPEQINAMYLYFVTHFTATVNIKELLAMLFAYFRSFDINYGFVKFLSARPWVGRPSFLLTQI